MQTLSNDADIKQFIVFEGIDGSGTTTQLARLSDALTGANVAHFRTAEPTSRPEGALIRSILAGKLDAAPGTVAYLFAADRHEHLYGNGGIMEHLAAGKVVICDRYILSSLAYQGITCGPALPELLNSRFPVPGLTVFFSIDPEVSIQRLGNRGALEIYEKLSFQKKVGQAYSRAIEKALAAGWNIVSLDASQNPDTVAAALFEAVAKHLFIESASRRHS